MLLSASVLIVLKTRRLCFGKCQEIQKAGISDSFHVRAGWYRTAWW